METAFQIKNISHITAELTFYLDNEATFNFQPKTLFIKPDENQFLVVSAKPKKLGIHFAKLQLIIKENPAVETIDLACIGCNLIFDITPQIIYFERVIINTCVQKTLILKNKSLVPLNWKFTNLNLFSKKYHIQTTYGYIKPCESVNVVIEYMSDTVEEVPKKLLEMQIFDEFCKNEPLLINFVELSAETCALLVTCEPHVIFGTVKARNTYTYQMELMNKGKYPLFLGVNDVDREGKKKKEINRLDMFQISTRNINMPSNKIVTIFMTFNPKKEMVIKDFPVFKFEIYDNIQTEKVVLQEFFITVDAETLFSR